MTEAGVITPPRWSFLALIRVLGFLKGYPRQVTVAVGMLLVNLGIEMTLPQIIGNAITGLRHYQEQGVPFDLARGVALFLGLVLVRALFAFILGPIRNRAVQGALGDVRAALFNAVQRLTFGYHDKAKSGELISRSTTDVWRLQDFFFACLFLSVDIVVSLTVILVLIALISPLLCGVALATLVPTVGLIAYYAGRLQPQWRRVEDLHSAMTTVIQENIAGVRVVKAFAREQGEVVKFQGKRDVYLGELGRTMRYWAARVPFAQFVYGLSVPLALWIGGGLVIDGALPIGSLATVVLYLMAIGHRMGAVGQFTNIMQHASASAERILEIMSEPRRIQSGPRSLPPGGGQVEFDHVFFQYQEGAPSLSDVSFVVSAGQTIAIVGPTGSGKSTLVNLIPRFYEAAHGRVLVEGVDVRELQLDQLRRSVGVIFQETFLFSATVAENIRYGNPRATQEEIERCARAAQAHEFIHELEKGYETVIGERGVSLSGGQRQRLAIARAFLMNPRILILDDATASVDAQTERFIQEAMRELCRGRTNFIIAQRLSTVQHADLILVLKEGSIVERGRHEELIARGGFYREVFEKQISR